MAFLVPALAGLSFLLNPYQFDEPHSARYNLPVIRSLDPALYASDPVIASFSRFRSWFYDGVMVAGRALRLSPDGLPNFLRSLYAVYLIGCFTALVGISRTLDKSKWLLLLVAVLSLQPFVATVGGDALFLATLTHREAAVVLGLFVLWMALANRIAAALVLLSAAVFVHPITAFEVGWCVIPPLVLSNRRDRPFVLAAGLSLLAASLLVYFKIAAPATSFDRIAASLFLSHNGNINHVSLFGQAPFAWPLLGATLVLALVSRCRVPQDESASARRVEQLWLWGATIAITASIAYSVFGSYRLAHLQPLRAFVWVEFLAWVEIAVVAVKSWNRDKVLASILVAAIGFKAAGLMPWILFVLLGIFYAAADIARPARTAVNRVAAAAASVLILAGSRTVFHSLRTPSGLLLCGLAAACVVLAAWGSGRARQLGAIYLMLAVSVGSIARREREREGRPPADWRDVTTWVANHTAPGDQILTPPDTHDFRTLARRTPVSEPEEPMWWVDPKLAAELESRDEAVRKACSGPVCDCRSIARLADEWCARGFIIHGACREAVPPAHQSSAYRYYDLNAAGAAAWTAPD